MINIYGTGIRVSLNAKLGKHHMQVIYKVTGRDDKTYATYD